MDAAETVIHSTAGNPAIYVVPNRVSDGWTLMQAGERITMSDKEMDALISHVRSQHKSTAVTPAKARIERYLT